MNKILRRRISLLTAFVLISAFKTFSQVAGDFRSSGLNTSWNNIAAWERYDGASWVAAAAGQTPGAAGQGGNVLIRDGHSITHNIALATAIASLTVGEGTSGSLTIGSFNFTVSGTSTITSGAIVTNTGTTGTKTLTGDFTNNGTWTSSSTSLVTFSGNWTNNNSWTCSAATPITIAGNFNQNGGTFTSGTGVYTFSGATKTLGGTATTVAVNNITVTGTYTNNITTLTCSTALAGAGTLTLGANTTLNITGTSAITGLNCTANTPNDVVYNNTAAQTIKATTYYNLNKSGTAASTSAGNIVVNNNLVVNSGTFTMSSTFTLSVGGYTSIAIGASFTSSSSGLHTFTGDFTNFGTFNRSTAGTNTMSSILLNYGTFTTSANTTVAGNAGANTGTLSIATAATFAVTGTMTINSGASFTCPSTGALSFTGDITNNGTWNKTGGGTVAVAGNLTHSGTTFTSGSGIYTFSGTSKSISTGNSSSLSITSAIVTGSYTFSSSFTNSNPLSIPTLNLSVATSNVINDAFLNTTTSTTVTNATSLFTNNATHTSGTTTITAAGSTYINNGTNTNTTLTLTNAASVYTNNGTTTVVTTFGGSTSATFTNNANSILYNTAATTNPNIAASASPNTVEYNRTNTQTIRGGGTYHDLIISGSNTKTLGAAITVNEDITVTGTATLADGAFQITGNASVGTLTVGSGCGYYTTRTSLSWFPTNTPLSSVFLDDNSTVTYAAATTIASNVPSTYGHLTFFGATTKTLPSFFPITVNGNLTISGGVMNDANNIITVKGNIASTGTHSGGGTVLLALGSAPHGVQGSGWNNIELDDTQGASLTAAFTIGTTTTGTFTFTDGVLAMNNFNFQMTNQNASAIVGSSFSSTKMILQNGSGNFTRYISNSTFPSTYIFPIGENTGTTEYSPVTVTVTANSLLSLLGFRVVDSQYSGDLNTNDYVSRHWTVTTAPSSFTYSAVFGYNAADVVGTESTFDVYIYDTSSLSWELIPATSGSNISTYDGTDGTFSTSSIFTIKAPQVIPGTVTIDGVGGSAGVYASLTGTTGFFNYVNQGVITQNVTVNISAASITETGAIALYQAYETGAGAGTYTITIQSADASQKVLTSTYSVATVGLQGTIRLNGADRVTFNGGTGTDRRLLLRNTDTGVNGVVVQMLNDASNNQINNCTIEGSITSTTLGLIHIGTTVITGTGNDNNVITNNDIKQNASATPGIGVSSNGFSTSVTNDGCTISNNNFANIFRTTSSVAAIYLQGNNVDYTIDGNRIYNETPRTGAIGSTIYGIWLDNSTNLGIDVTNNIIGFANSSGTGISSFVSTAAVRFVGIYFSSSALVSSPMNNITGNVIDNITVTSTSGGATNLPLFNGIYVTSARYLMDNNRIGSLSGSPTIVLSSTTATTLANCPNGISAFSTASGQTISNNKIGGISFALASGTLAMNMNGIKVTTGSVDIIDNEVGNATAHNMVQFNPGTGASVNYGIYCTSTSTYTINIEGNAVRNLSSNGIGTASQVAGIYATGQAVYNIENNQISHLRTTSTSTSTGASAAVNGITFSSAGTQTHTIEGNEIFALVDSSAANAIVNGIYFIGGTGISVLNRNTIYNLRSGTGSGSIINGLHVATSPVTVSNNMIRLGYDAYGATITNTSVITGILKDNNSVNNGYYYNSVYIGGTGVGSTANNTYAFRRNTTGANDNVRNNIFVNARSNNTTGGKHYAVYLNNTTTLTLDYNLYHVTGNGGNIGFNGSADQSTLQAWKANTVFDDNTGSADPQFISPTSVVPNLKLNTSVSTPAESGAVAITGVTDDIDTAGIRTGYPLGGQTNGGGTSPDIGADEGDFIAQDIIAPVISVGAIAPINAACGSSQTVVITATITDASTGVASGGLSPLLWWRLSSGTYASLAASSVVGNVYTYNLNLTGIAALQTYHYYIAAQDQATTPNISYSHSDATSPVHANVAATPSPINSAPGTFTILATVPLSGTVNVGTGQTYTSLNANNSTGLFFALQTNGLSGNLTVNITSDLNESGLYYPLTNVSEFCGSGYTVTIKPSAAAIRTIYQTAGGNPMINLQGATRLIIDGSFGGSGRYLTFANRQNSPTIYFNGNCNNDTIRNCIIEGNNTLTSSVGPGVINFAGLLGTGTAISDIVIDNNEIRNRSDLAQTAANTPTALINMGGVIGLNNGTSAPVKSNITISNNIMYNFRQSAIAISQNSSGNGIGDNIVITGNKIYQPITQAQYQYVIYIDGGSNAKNHIISNNQIGGSSLPSPNITGTWLNNALDGEIWAIYANTGGIDEGEETIIDNNTISNMTVSGTGWSNFLGIRVEYGRTNVTNNMIGSLSSSLSTPNIVCAGNGDIGLTDNSAIMGIWTQSEEDILIDSNTVCGLSATGAYSFMDCIAHGSNLYLNGFEYSYAGGKATITNNNVMYNRSGSALQSLVISPEAFMGIFCWTDAEDNLLQHNKVYNCGSNTSLYNTNTRFHGMFIGIHGSETAQTGIVDGNEVSYLFNENPGDNTNSTSRNPIVYGITLANGDWTVSNNTIYINNGTLGGSLITNTNTSIRALCNDMLYDQANCAARFYHNTVYVSGSNSTGLGTANSTYAFLRFPLDWNALSITAGAPTELRNNIFINDRGGQGNHRPLGNIANSNANAAINWDSSTSDYNLISGPSLTNIALWGSSTTYTLANFQSLSGGGDPNTQAVLTSTSTSDATHIKPSELFVNLAALSQADLRIGTTSPSTPYPYNFVDGLGTPVAEVTSDIDGTTRSLTTPTLGAFEINPCATPSITPGSIASVCFSTSSQNVTLSYSGATNSPDEYSIDWNTAANTAGFSDFSWTTLPASPITITVPANAAAATYTGTLTVRNSSSTCQSIGYSISVTVNAAPSIVPGSNPSVCFSASSQNASLTYSGATGSPNQYSIGSWSGGSFSDVTNAALPASPILINVPAGTTAGTYTAVLTVRNSTTTCQSTNYNISVTVNEAPAITTYSPGPTSASFSNSICAGSNTAFGITATGSGLTYNWQLSTNGGTNWSSTGLSSAPYSGQGSAMLSINNTPGSFNGNLYRVIVGGTCAPPDTSDAGSLFVGFASIDTNPPSSTVVCENGNTSITVGASGNSLTYSWEISTNGGGSWTALSNGGVYSGTATQTLQITGALLSMNSYQYRVIVGTISCTSQTSTVSTLTVNPEPGAAGTISGTPSLCQSTNGVSFSVGAIANATGYTWNLPSGATIASGANTNSITVDFSGSAVSGDITVTGTNSCGNGTTSPPYNVTVNPNVIPSVVISSDAGIVFCAGTNVTFTATPTNGGSTPVYQWKLNGGNVGTDSPTYNNSTLQSGDDVTCDLTSNAPCAAPVTVSGNILSVTVLPSVTPTVSISADNANICVGTTVTYTANAQFGGSSPSYSWKLNGNDVGTNSPTYMNSSLSSGDEVEVVLTSNETCASPLTATSNTITIAVLPNVTPSVSIAASPSNSECSGNNVTFTASPVNGGGIPSYQWKVNGNDVGTNSDSFSSTTLNNGDVVSVVMTTSAACATTPTASSNNITMTIIAAPQVDAGTPMNTCGTGAYLFANGASVSNSPSYVWTENGAGSITSGLTSLTPTYNIVAGDLGQVVTFTLIADGNGGCEEVLDQVTLTIADYTSYYTDADGDGFGDPASTPVLSCVPVPGRVADNTDCCDTNADINPDCEWWADQDGDGYGSYIYTEGCITPDCVIPAQLYPWYPPAHGGAQYVFDCNDFTITAYPGSVEVCGNQIDDDCDGSTDEGCSGIPNDQWNNAQTVNVTSTNAIYPSCQWINGTLFNADISAQGNPANVAVGGGRDVWYRFTAPSTGVQIKVAPNSFNVVIELQNSSATQINVENVNASSGGGEVLNFGNLTVGQIYYVGVRNYENSPGGSFTICISPLMPSGCATVVPAEGLSLCNSYKATYRAASTYTFNFTGTGGTAPLVTTSGSSTGLIPLTTPSLGIRYGGVYSVKVDANYVLTDGIGQTEPTITVLGSSSTVNCSNVFMMNHPLMEVKANQRCPAVVPRTTYLIGTPVPGSGSICGAVSYTYEFQQYSSCNGTSTGLPFEVTTNTNTPYLALAAAFPAPTYPMANTGSWRVRIKPNFAYGSGVYGPAQMVQVGNTASSTMLPEGEMIEQEKSITFENVSSIYPNPNSGEFLNINVVIKGESVVLVRIKDALGRDIEQHNFVVDQELNTQIVFQSDLAPGIYFTEFVIRDESFTHKFIVE